jgi:hypothetical protein
MRAYSRRRGESLLLTCRRCSATFERPLRSGKPCGYCESCRQIVRRQRSGHYYQPHPFAVARSCERCQKPFIAKRGIQRFCSLLCQSPTRFALRPVKNCRRCGRLFKPRPDQIFCRPRCRELDQHHRLSKRTRDQLRDGYLRANLSRQSAGQLSPSEVPPELIKAYRSVLLVKREVKRRLNQ